MLQTYDKYEVCKGGQEIGVKENERINYQWREFEPMRIILNRQPVLSSRHSTQIDSQMQIYGAIYIT